MTQRTIRDERLRLCPFCGCAPVIIQPNEDHPSCWVTCNTCRLSCTPYATRDEAIAAWNRRAPATLPSAAPTPAAQPPPWERFMGSLKTATADLEHETQRAWREQLDHAIETIACERILHRDLKARVERLEHVERAIQQQLAAPMAPPPADEPPPDERDVVAQGSINEPTIDEIGRIMRVLQDAIDQEAQAIVAEKPDAPPMLMKPGAIWPRQWNAAARAVFKHVAEIWGWTVPTDYPRVCPVCGWTRTGLRNYGTPDAPRWLCHGCAARALAANAAKLDDPRFYGPNVTCPICDPHEPGLRERATQHHPSCSLGLSLSGKPIPEDGVIRQPKPSP